MSLYDYDPGLVARTVAVDEAALAHATILEQRRRTQAADRAGVDRDAVVVSGRRGEIAHHEAAASTANTRDEAVAHNDAAAALREITFY